MIGFGSISSSPISSASSATYGFSVEPSGGAVCGGSAVQLGCGMAFTSSGFVAGGSAHASVKFDSVGMMVSGGISPHQLQGDLLVAVYNTYGFTMTDTTKRFVLTEV